MFNLHPFQSCPRRPSMGGRSASSYELYKRSFSRPDVPEAVTGSEPEDGDPLDVDDGNGWCRRRSTFASVALLPQQQQAV